MSDEDFSAAGGANPSHTPGKHRGPRFSWTPDFEATFFRSLCESVALGLREGSTFKHEAWDRAITALIERHGAYANKSHLINKSDNARKKYRLWRGLREDPAFLYDRASRTVTASEDAWKRHLEKEPLARSLKGRPFEHEEYYEKLFPDVIGSGGAPKRLTKPRRRGQHSNGLDEPDTPGTGMMELMDTTYTNPPQTHIPPPMPPSFAPPQSAIAPPPPHQQQQQHPRSSSNAVPLRSSIASSSALTPPEDPALHSRKRFQVSDGSKGANSGGGQQEKRRRTNAAAAAAAAAATVSAPSYLDLTQPGTVTVTAPISAPPSAPALPPPAAATPSSASNSTDGVLVLAEAIRIATLRPAWAEKAIDIFFRDFPDEDPDLQLKIAEKALTDENKAMVFCKMPDKLRRHWVRRLREVHNRMG